MNAAHKLRLILADDHPVVRDGLAAIINQQQDMEVVAEAENGEEAVDLYERQRPDAFAEALAGAKRALDPGWNLNPGVLLDAASRT